MTNPVCKKIRGLRFQHGFTQVELADKAGIPRASLANMESEKGNPSIASLVKVSSALGVSIDELVNSEPGLVHTSVKREDMRVYQQDNGKFLQTLLSPLNAPYININEINMLPGCNTKGRPHPKGSHEFFFCLEGKATIKIKEEIAEVESGNLIYFEGNLPHMYSNFGVKAVYAISVVTHRTHLD